MFRAPARGKGFRASGHGSLLAAVPKVTKKTARNPGFWTSCTLFRLRICHRLPRVRGTQSLSCRMTYRLFVLRRCRSCNATVEDEALLDGAMRASRPTEFYRWSAVGRGRGVKKTCRWHVFSLRSRRLCRRSIHLIFEGTTSPRHTIGAQCPFPHQSAVATREQRRFDNDATTRILRGRAAGSPDSVQRAARREVKEPEVPSGAFAYFCHCWQK